MTVAEVAERVGAPRPADAIAGVEIAGYSIDSRTTRERDLFFAVRGERLDGHDFVRKALDSGAVAAVVDRGVEGVDAERFLPVADALGALQNLARGVLADWGGPVVGVTGSAGKTTTKDLTARVLGAAGPTHKSVGNFNNAYGLPKSVLEMATDGRSPSDFRFAVLEMGMSTPGEIRRLTELAPPRVGVVTIVAPVHLEFFEDGIEGIARAKAELVDGIQPGGTAVLNADDERVARMAESRSDIETLLYGVERGDVVAEGIEPEGLSAVRFRLVTPSGSEEVRLPLVGRHNVSNALAAAGAGIALGLSTDVVAEALSSAEPSKMRGQVLRLANGTTVVDDSYNSNPTALDEMVSALGVARAARRIVVAGEMLELGPTSAELHRLSGRHAAGAGVHWLIGVRGDALALVEGAREAGMQHAEFVESPEEAIELLIPALEADDVVLVKGSRGVATDRVVAGLVRVFGKEEGTR